MVCYEVLECRDVFFGQLKGVAMDEEEVGSGNQRFLFTELPYFLCQEACARVVRASFNRPETYSFTGRQFSGRVRIDATDIERQSLAGLFTYAVSLGLLGQMSILISVASIDPSRTEVTAVRGRWQFSLRITRYTRDDGSVVTDPLSLPDGERLGRCVDLTITALPGKYR